MRAPWPVLRASDYCFGFEALRRDRVVVGLAVFSRRETPIDPISVIGDAFDFSPDRAQRRKSCKGVSVNLAYILWSSLLLIAAYSWVPRLGRSIHRKPSLGRIVAT